VTLSAKELAKRVEQSHGNYEVKTHHPGTDSPDGCGSNSEYDVIWAIRRPTKGESFADNFPHDEKGHVG
jgi:hypothetical protein